MALLGFRNIYLLLLTNSKTIFKLIKDKREIVVTVLAAISL